MPGKWMSCSACRTDIAYGAKHWVCSVSTCNSGRIKLVFCSVACWDSHVAAARHRESWAVEAFAPSSAGAPPPEAPRAAPAAPATAAAAAPVALADASEEDILVVVSKVKKYIRDRSGMNTSDAVAAMLSDHVRAVCDLAIRTAGADGRKTVLDRDVPRARR